MIKHFLKFILLLCIFTSCQDERPKADVSKISIQTTFKRFDQAFYQLDTNNFEDGLNRLKTVYSPFFASEGSIDFWKYQRNNPEALKLYVDVQKTFGDFKALDNQLNLAMKRYYWHFPKSDTIQFYSYISNLDFDYPILFADTICFAASDMYLGANKEYYAQLPSYIGYFRNPKFTVRDCIHALVTTKIKPNKDASSLLDDMIYHGKQLYALKTLLPDLEDHNIVRYPKEKLDFCINNERSVWSYFVENDLLFDTKMGTKRRFIELAPFSKFRMNFDNETPGMIGYWVGWQIVSSYMATNPSITLEELFSETDSRKILKLSGYKP